MDVTFERDDWEQAYGVNLKIAQLICLIRLRRRLHWHLAIVQSCMTAPDIFIFMYLHCHLLFKYHKTAIRIVTKNYE